MIYAIFLCFANAGYCDMVPQLGVFQSSADCQALISRVWGPMNVREGRYYPVTPAPFDWAECDGKPTWQAVP
jgi:hypothetical protein